MNIDLNCDMGEGMGDDAAMLGIVSSANIACAAHAGDPLTMLRTMRLAIENGVAIGAHPGFYDRDNFGRTNMALPADELDAIVRFQTAAADGAARSLGAALSHLKLHGAMANMGSKDVEMALVCYRAARAVVPDLPLMVIAGTAQSRAAAELGGPVISEIFADRSYEPDGTLTPRGIEGAVIHDAEFAANRVVSMVTKGKVFPRIGDPIDMPIDSICVHGDTPGAVQMARVIRDRLMQSGFDIRAARAEPRGR